MNFNINSSLNHKSTFCKIPYTKLNINISKCLLRNGLISHYKKFFLKKNSTYIILYFKYFENKNVIRDFKLLSKSSRTIFSSNKNLYFKKNCLVLSNSNGYYIQSNNKNYNIGGKILFFINC